MVEPVDRARPMLVARMSPADFTGGIWAGTGAGRIHIALQTPLPLTKSTIYRLKYRRFRTVNAETPHHVGGIAHPHTARPAIASGTISASIRK
jgi:hypothetical protein